MKTRCLAVGLSVAMGVSSLAPTSWAQVQESPYSSAAYPAPAPTAPRSRARRSTGAMVGGIVMTSVGGLAIVIGGVLLLGGSSSSTQVCSNGDCHQSTRGERESMQTAGAFVLGTGIVLGAIGIPLISWGAQRGTRASAAPQTALSLQASPTSMGLLLTF